MLGQFKPKPLKVRYREYYIEENNIWVFKVTNETLSDEELEEKILEVMEDTIMDEPTKEQALKDLNITKVYGIDYYYAVKEFILQMERDVKRFYVNKRKKPSSRITKNSQLAKKLLQGLREDIFKEKKHRKTEIDANYK
jgi:hypothetical protein